MKVRCPFHDDRSPSMEVYADGGFCFVCNRQATPQELGMEAQDLPKELEPEPIDFSYIDSLPLVALRGLEFPADEDGYFIVWPDRSYWKLRLYDDSKGRYRSPRGHKEPTFWASQALFSDTLVVVEGQINALSIYEAVGKPTDVMSLGGVGNFSRKLSKIELQSYYRYSTILIVCDEDGPGAKAAINLYSQLIGGNRRVRMRLMGPDANDVLCSANGKDELKKIIEGELRRAVDDST